MSVPTGASPAGSVATGAMPAQSSTKPLRTMAAISCPDIEIAKAATITNWKPCQPRRRANQTDKANKSAVSASESLAMVGTTISGEPSTRIGPPPAVTVSASLPTRPSAPVVAMPTRIFWPLAGR